MNKNLKKFKEGFLAELSIDDSTKEQVKSKLNLKSSGKTYKKSAPAKWKKPVIFSCASFALAVICLITIISVINYTNTPVYKGMFAENSVTGRLNLEGESEYTGVIEDIKEEIGIVVDDRIVCYAQPGEEILITVQIENPKFFEILSFTLNGRLYQTYEFVEGSNSTQIIVKFVAQETSGLQTITIDAIKYVDDTTIKNARFDGNKTINIGVTYQNVPNVTGVNEISSTTNFGVSFVVNDVDKLINVETGLKIYLFDHEKLLNVTNVTLGMNVIPYSNLKLGSDYAYVIMGVFDLYDGQGKQACVLHQSEFRTEEGFSYKTVETTYDSVKLEFEPAQEFEGSIIDIAIYKGDELAGEIDPTLEELKLSGLLSNTEYLIKAAYKYNLEENGEVVEVIKVIEHTFKTEERPVPVVEIIGKEMKKDGLEIDYVIQDTTDVGKIIKVELYHKDQLVTSFDEDKRVFEGLLSDNDYKVVTTYEYDLLDGTGTKTLTVENTFHTEKKEIPTAIFTNTVGFGSMVYVWFEVKDPDSVIKINAIEVYKDDEYLFKVESFDNYNQDSVDPSKYTGDTALNNLEKGTYRFVIVYEYDLNDGKGVITVDKDHPTADNKILFELK